MNSLGAPEEIRERHGVTTGPEALINVNEDEAHVTVVVREGGYNKVVYLSPDEARYIASKLRRVAWRVEARQ